MDKTTRLVFDALDSEGAAILTLCRTTGLFAADIVDSLDKLVQLGWVEKRNELFYQVSPRTSSINQVIDYHVRNTGEQNNEHGI